MAIEPIAYGGISSVQRGRRNRIRLTSAIKTQHNGNESNLSQLDADVKEEQRGRNMVLRQANFTKCAGKPETM